MKNQLFFLLTLSFGFCLISPALLQAQDDEDRPGNTSFTLGFSPHSIGYYTLPPVGFIADFGVNKWGAIGLYMGYQFRNDGGPFGLPGYTEHGAVAGVRVTAQVFSILNEFLSNPINIRGLKPYVGFASGNRFYYDEYYEDLDVSFSASPVVGARYYPTNGIGFLAEIGETFNGQTGLNLGIVFGGR